MICIDALGPRAVTTYPGAAWKVGAERATFEPDYGRRGKLHPEGTRHGAFEPASGTATVVDSPRRDSASHIRLRAQMMTAFPADRWLLIEDNLGAHISQETQLALIAWPEIQVQFVPTYACWRNVIEPWWKHLRSLARKGRRFDTMDDLMGALDAAVRYWNPHKHPYQWKKRPQVQPMLLGGLHPALRGTPIVT